MIKINRIIAGVLTLAAMMGSAVECRAVSDREMEEARAIAAKAYLRYANNGSGYLDEVNAKSIAELQKSLKAKEKENIKAFLAIPVPKDYATWDKTKLVEYWGSTAFKAAGLIEEGKGARPRVRKQIMAMSISAPSAAAPAETPAEAAPAPAEAAPAEASVAEQPAEAAAADPAAQQADILADQKAIEDDAKNAAPESQNSGSNSTWIYVVILCVLIGVVVWLVYRLFLYLLRSNLIATLVSIVAGVFTYAALLLMLKGLTEQEILRFPKGRTLVKLARKMHLLR